MRWKAFFCQKLYDLGLGCPGSFARNNPNIVPILDESNNKYIGY